MKQETSETFSLNDKDHKQYGDSSIYENTPGDQTKFYLELPG